IMTTSQIGIPIIHGHGRWDLLTMSNRIHNLYRHPVGQPPQEIFVGNTSTTKRGIRVRLKCMTRLPMCWWKPGHLPTKKPTNKKIHETNNTKNSMANLHNHMVDFLLQRQGKLRSG